MPVADAARDLDGAPAGNLGEIERARSVENAEMHGVPGRGCERLEMRARDLHDIRLALREKAEFEQFGTEVIAEARREGEIAAFDERRGEPVRGRTRETEPE